MFNHLVFLLVIPFFYLEIRKLNADLFTLYDAIKQEVMNSKIQEPEFCVTVALKQNFQPLLHK